MTTVYNKLVRDKIPEIIASEGRNYAIETMSEDEYRAALLTKIVEEAEEVRTASDDKLIVEIADLYEVLDSLLELSELDIDNVRKLQQQRREDRGGFSKRIRLLWTD